MSSSINSIIKREYEKRQKASSDLLEEKKNELYEKIPRLEEIDREIQFSGLKYNKMLILENGNTEAIISNLEEAISLLKAEKASLLTGNGFTADYLDPVYKCRKCKDTGTIKLEEVSGDTLCSCYRQLMIDLIYKQSNLKHSQTDNFNSFNENFYSNKVDESRYGIKKSPRKQILGIKDNCIKFIEDFCKPETKNLMFFGPTGTGKTFMTNCIAVELMNKGVTVLYLTAPVLFSTISEYRSRAFGEEVLENSIYKNIMEVELLIIDDLSTESQSAARYAEFLTILDTRLANNKSRPCKTIISTNITMNQLYQYYDERVGSRIIGNFDIYKFAGDDIREYKARMSS